MTHWEWDPSLSVGIDDIDDQHKQIVECINVLETARRTEDRDKMSAVLKQLIDYTVTHFAYEEEFMQKAGYPLSEPHKQVHDSFALQIQSYAEQHEAGKDISRLLTSDLKIWLTNHIKYQDQDYASYIHKTPEKKKGWIARIMGRLSGKSD